MLRFVSRRLFYALVILLIVIIAVYAIFALLPFNPAALTCGQHCTPQIVHSNAVRLGYDKPLIEQFWLYLHGILMGRTYGAGAGAPHCSAPSFGFSYNQNECVTTLLAQAFPVTISLAIGALIMWLIVGVGLGILAARQRGKFLDTASSVFVLLGTSLPVFVTGLFLLIWISIKLHWIAIHLSGYVSIFQSPLGFISYFFLPWVTLAFAFAALYTRFTRSTILETLSEDYVRTARAKGLRESVVFRKHTFRAALAPIATMASLDFAGLIGGAILTESIFNLPGLGHLTIDSIFEFDLPVVIATTIVAAAVVIVMNLVVDLLYAVLDPRVRV
jgi:peptide/nickel transport system permease protein